MICQPIEDADDEEIERSRSRAAKRLTDIGFRVAGPVFTDRWYMNRMLREKGVKHGLMRRLGEDIRNMALCDAVYFAAGWENDLNCRMEHEAAKEFGLVLIYEEKEYETAKAAYEDKDEDCG